MNRKSFAPAAWAMPQPVSIIGTYGEDGTPDAMNAAWTGQYDSLQVVLCLSAGHRTTKNILARKEFTISFGTKDQLEACDYVGIVSGNTVTDKVKKNRLDGLQSRKGQCLSLENCRCAWNAAWQDRQKTETWLPIS